MATVTLGTLSAFAVTCLVIELTPGPNMAYLAILSATKGRRAGFAATLGVALGLSIVGLAAVLGFTALIANSRMLYVILRWGGVVYLLWLAYEGWYGEEDITRHSRNRSTRFQVFSAWTGHQSTQSQGWHLLHCGPADLCDRDTSGDWASYFVISHLRDDCHAGSFNSRAPC